MDFFRLDFTQSTHLIIDAVSPNPVALDAQLLDASGTEIGENVYSLADLLSYLPGGGFWILGPLQPRDVLRQGVASWQVGAQTCDIHHSRR